MRKILLIKLSSLGDVLATSILPKLIHDAERSVEIHHMVMEHCAVVTKKNPYISKQIVTPFLSGSNLVKNILAAAKIIIQMRKNRYDKVFIFHRNPLISIMVMLGGPQELYGFKNATDFLLTKKINYTKSMNRTLQEVELLRLGGIEVETPNQLEFYPESEVIPDKLDNLLPERYVACNPGGGNPHSNADNRMWPIQNYASLIKFSPLPYVILGHGQSDQERVDQLINLVEPQKVINLVGKTSFSETALILQRAALYVGNDSSLVFLGAAMGTKTLGLYGPTQVEAANPIGKAQYTVRSNSPCAPCYNPYDGIKGKMYTCEKNVCMQEITVKTVLDKIIEILNHKG